MSPFRRRIDSEPAALRHAMPEFPGNRIHTMKHGTAVSKPLFFCPPGRIVALFTGIFGKNAAASKTSRGFGGTDEKRTLKAYVPLFTRKECRTVCTPLRFSGSPLCVPPSRAPFPASPCIDVRHRTRSLPLPRFPGGISAALLPRPHLTVQPPICTCASRQAHAPARIRCTRDCFPSPIHSGTK